MLTGMHPFRGNNEKDLFAKISRGMFRIPETINFEAKAMINKLLSIDPEKRPRAHEMGQFRWLST